MNCGSSSNRALALVYLTQASNPHPLVDDGARHPAHSTSGLKARRSGPYRSVKHVFLKPYLCGSDWDEVHVSCLVRFPHNNYHFT